MSAGAAHDASHGRRVAAVSLSAALWSHHMITLRRGAASCWECGARYPRRPSLTCMPCMYMFITFSCSVFNVYYTDVTQLTDNVSLSCLLAMANVAVSYCRDGLCRSGLWAKCLLTHSHIKYCGYPNFRYCNFSFILHSHYYYYYYLFIYLFLCYLSFVWYLRY